MYYSLLGHTLKCQIQTMCQDKEIDYVFQYNILYELNEEYRKHMRVMITRARKQIKDVKKGFTDEYTNYNLLEDTLNTDYKIVLSCENIVL